MTNTTVPQWEERKKRFLEKFGQFHYPGISSPSFSEMNIINFMELEIKQAIQEDRQRIVEMIEKYKSEVKYPEGADYIAVVAMTDIINLINKE